MTTDFQDSAASPDEKAALVKTPPPNFMILRANKPERLHADDMESAVQTVKRQVVNSQAPIVYIYQLVSAEIYVPTSQTLPVTAIPDFLNKVVTTVDDVPPKAIK